MHVTIEILTSSNVNIMPTMIFDNVTLRAELSWSRRDQNQLRTTKKQRSIETWPVDMYATHCYMRQQNSVVGILMRWNRENAYDFLDVRYETARADP